MSTPLIRVFSRNAVWGWGEREIASVGRKNVKNIQKQTKFVIVWVGEGRRGGGGGGGDLEHRWEVFSPLKALKKKTKKKKTLPLISLSLFRVTKLKYYVGCKSQKATKNTIISDSELSLSAFQS